MRQEQNQPDPNATSVDGSGSSAPELSGFLAEALSRSAWEHGVVSGGKSEREGAEQVAVSSDDLFELLSNPRRRYVLYYLTKHAAEVDLGTLATQIAAWENDIELSQVSGMERKRVYTSLQQVHLPKMDDSGVVTFDKRSGMISLNVSLTELEFGERYHNEYPWHRYYALLSVGNASFATLVMSSVWPLVAVSESLLVAWILVSHAVLVAVHAAVSTTRETMPRFS